MCSNGWISLDRKVQEHWIWKDKPFSQGQAWIDLLLRANHSENKFPLGSEIVTVERGSFITSELKLMDAWGWSKSKTRRFLKLLENDSMIVKKTDHKKTAITIVNYGSYQDIETKKRPKKNHSQTIRRPLKDTNNNENNDNNDNKYSDVPELNQTIIDFIEYRKKIKAPMTDKAVQLMIGKLNKLSSSTDIQIKILNQSILNGWKGIFEMKQQSCKHNNRFNNFENQRNDSIDESQFIDN